MLHPPRAWARGFRRSRRSTGPARPPRSHAADRYSIIKPHADTVGAADTVIDAAVGAAAARACNVRRRCIERIVDRGIDQDVIVPAIGAAEVGIDDPRYAVVVHI